MLESNAWDALAAAHIDLALAYADCAARHEAVVRAYEEAGEQP